MPAPPRKPRRTGSYAAFVVGAAYLAATSARIAIEGRAGPPPSAAAHEFDGADAQRVLRTICIGGPRAAGSAHAEIDTVALLIGELDQVASAASASGAQLEVEVHHGTGSFYTDFMDGFAIAYANISSVVARLSWPSSRRDAILLGAHYDSFPTSPGSSDNAVNVAASIGVIRALAAGPPLEHSILVLLNGAEESFMVAAHGFALSHRWATDYRVVLNLEAIGAAGASVVFQLGPDAPWLAAAVGRSYRPRGTVIAHDLFQIPGFPAATDWKTLVLHAPRAHANDPGGAGRANASDEEALSFGDAASMSLAPHPVGLDMATLGNGYVYHTPLDKPELMSETQMRTLGVGTLSMVRAIDGALTRRAAPTAVAAQSSTALGGGTASGQRPPQQLPRREAHENSQSLDGVGPGAVYFDYCSLCWIAYSRQSARWLHTLASVLALAALAALGVTRRHAVTELVAFAAALGVCATAGAVIHLLRPLATFGSESLAIALYGSISCAVGLVVREASLQTTHSQPSSAVARHALSRQLGGASLSPWLLLLIALEAADLPTAYLAALFLATNSIALLTAHLVAGLRAPPAVQMGLQLLGGLFPTMHMNGICGWLLQVLIPITGRAGAALPTDIVVAVVVGLSSALPSGCLLAPVHAARHQARVLLRLLVVTAVAACGLAALRQPFTDERPKRLLVHHVGRQVEGRVVDAGLWISSFDASGLRELRQIPALGVPAVTDETPHACDLDVLSSAPAQIPDTGCYFSFPFFLPLSGITGKPDGRSSVYATSMVSATGRLVPVASPVVPPAERLTLDHVHTNTTISDSGIHHRLTLRICGSAQMMLIVPEGRLTGWSLAPGLPPPRRSPFAPHERVVFAFLTSGGGDRAGHGRRIWDVSSRLAPTPKRSGRGPGMPQVIDATSSRLTAPVCRARLLLCWPTGVDRSARLGATASGSVCTSRHKHEDNGARTARKQVAVTAAWRLALVCVFASTEDTEGGAATRK